MPTVSAHWLRLSNVAGAEAALLEILLVILFGAVERSRWLDHRHDGPPIATTLLLRLLRGVGCRLLLGRMVEDGRAILVADVWSLPVELCGGMVVPERHQQILVAQRCRHILHTHL